MTRAIPIEIARMEAVQQVRIGGSNTRASLSLTAFVGPAAPAQISVFDQEVEVIQPLRLTVEGELQGRQETKTRDFILAARYGFDVDQDWNLILIELEPARFF